ncbi:hypothetical protein [Hyphomicrobium sp. MC1]|uniref:hypothetical protein n=1 Tax=Hyphomicrobium sp. (strain MC1) TaxID=717785 RepID=UPI000213DA89|nr:hypothetical protein [Hyphomicrobium sp. MC1]CCB64430.1 protein of unknown function [Hyphomicrobium sp. MC1]
MTTIESLRSLQGRLREAKGPSRELDAELHAWRIGGTSLGYLSIDDCWLFSFPNAARTGIDDNDLPRFTTFPEGLGACVGLCMEVLPGWAWKTGTCCVSDDAWVVPDFNCPVHGERLLKQFGPIAWGSIWDTGIDIDRRPAGNACLALLDAIVSAKLSELEAQETVAPRQYDPLSRDYENEIIE